LMDRIVKSVGFLTKNIEPLEQPEEEARCRPKFAQPELETRGGTIQSHKNDSLMAFRRASRVA